MSLSRCRSTGDKTVLDVTSPVDDELDEIVCVVVAATANNTRRQLSHVNFTKLSDAKTAANDAVSNYL